MQPNILLIMTDQHRHDAMGCAGDPVVQTPHLDALAAQGARFSRAYCQGPLCQPARASVLTGRYPHEHGIVWNNQRFDPAWATMPKALQAAGYETAVVGKCHFGNGGGADQTDTSGVIGPFGFDHVFEEFDKPTHLRPGGRTPYTEYLRARGLFEPYAEQVKQCDFKAGTQFDGRTGALSKRDELSSFTTRAAIEWLRTRRNDKPFFLWLSIVQPHPPYIDPPEWAEVYRDADIPLPETRRPTPATGSAWEHYLESLAALKLFRTRPEDVRREARRHYYGSISLIDECVGDVVTAVDAGGDETWVLFTADHGDMLGDHDFWGKTCFYEPSNRVPAIVRPPGGQAGVVVDAPVEAIDLTRTIVELADADARDTRGKSLIPFLHGTGPDDTVAFSEQSGDEGRDHFFVAVATRRWRFTWDRLTKEACELFDLEADPNELENVVDDPAHNALVEELLNELVVPFEADRGVVRAF